MVVEEEGELDVVVTKEDLEREQAKLDRLKAIDAEKKKLIGKDSTTEEKAEAKGAATAAKTQAKKVKVMSKQLAEIERKQKEQDTKFKNFFNKFGKGVTSPQGLIQEGIESFMSSSRAIPIIGAIIAASVGVFKAIEKEFGPGGIFDLRLKVFDIVKSILGLLHLIDIESGEVFMAADTSSPFNVAHTNNTETKRDGHVRYNQVTFGLQ